MTLNAISTPHAQTKQEMSRACSDRGQPQVMDPTPQITVEVADSCKRMGLLRDLTLWLSHTFYTVPRPSSVPGTLECHKHSVGLHWGIKGQKRKAV